MGVPVTVKGQVTIPKPIRDRLRSSPGSEVEFAIDADGRFVLQKAGQRDAAAPGRLARQRAGTG